MTLHQLEAVTPKKHDIELICEDNKKIHFYKDYDVVGVSYYTATANRAYEIADQFRENGTKVVLGGYHASALPSEAKQHADAVVIGEAEETWPQLLNDIENNRFKKFYSSEEPVDINNIPNPTLTKTPSLFNVGSIQATRGCPFECEFCAISNIKFGKLYRKKSVDKVINEIENIPYKYFVFYDGSITVDLDYAKDLFKRIKGLDKKFTAFGHANMVKDEEFLKLASEAGCIAWDIGFESIYQTTLDKLKKKANIVKEYGQVAKKLHEYGMSVVGSFIFGFDDHTTDVFDETFEALKRWDIDSVGATILTPLPGTKLYDRMKKENRLLTNDWSKYDMCHVVFEPKKMTSEELYCGTRRFIKEYFSSKNLFYRLINNSKNLGLISSIGINYYLLNSRTLFKSIYGL